MGDVPSESNTTLLRSLGTDKLHAGRLPGGSRVADVSRMGSTSE